jgi:hypothetical protein
LRSLPSSLLLSYIDAVGCLVAADRLARPARWAVSRAVSRQFG